MVHAENDRFIIAFLTADSIAYKIFMQYTCCVQWQETRTAYSYATRTSPSLLVGEFNFDSNTVFVFDATAPSGPGPLHS